MEEYAMPIHKLLYIEKYEAMLNGAMKYSLEFDTPNEEIIGFMAYIGKSQNCDRFYIFEDSTHGEFTSNTYEWCAPGITAEKDTLQKVEKSTLKTWYDMYRPPKVRPKNIIFGGRFSFGKI